MSKVGEYYRELEEMGILDTGPQHPSEMEFENGKFEYKKERQW